MTLSDADKLEIYQLRKNGVSWSRIRQVYKVAVSNLKYMVRLMNRYGIEIVKKSKNISYPPELKQVMIDQVLVEGRSQLNERLRTDNAYLAVACCQSCRHYAPNSWISLAGLSVTRFASNG